jgi:hypothetical protein
MLQHFDMVADRRLAEMHLPGGFRKAQSFGSMKKRFDFHEISHEVPSFSLHTVLSVLKTPTSLYMGVSALEGDIG